jgi:uncharacterized membrane protein YdjX (TVP38/TMEM64 family)
MKMNKKLALLVVFVGLIVGMRLLGWDEYISYDMLIQKRETLLLFVEDHYFLSALALVVLYALSVALMLPIATVLSLAAGFMFGAFFGLIFAVTGATLGAVASFYVARYVLGQSLQTKYEKELKKFNDGLEKDGYSYLFALRLIPIFPFFLVNLFCGLTKISLKTFFITTFFGIIPGGIAYTYAGSQLSFINDVGDIFTPQIAIALALFGLVALIPVIYKRFKKVPS